MKSFVAFIKKEWMEQVRSGRVMILGILFALFGIMNPAIAKLTPWLLELMSETLAETGMTVTAVTVDAMTSWTQFFKNIPMALIAFVLLQSSIFTKEYESGTLVLALTKGLERYKVVAAKTTVLSVLWTVGYVICFAVTYAYNAFFWDNSIAHNLVFAVICWWLLGLWTIVLLVFFSTVCRGISGVLLGTGGVFFVSYLAGLLPKLKEYMPTTLMNAGTLLVGTEGPDFYTKAILVAVISSVVLMAIGIEKFKHFW